MTDGNVEERALSSSVLLNLSGAVIPAVTGLAVIPYLVHGLGLERFGVLSLAWVLISYLTLFDLGLGRATVRYVAQALGRGEQGLVSEIFWTSLAVQAVLGISAGILVASTAPAVIGPIIQVSPRLVPEARSMLSVLALALPLLIWSASVKGVLEAYGRFGLVNIVRSAGGAGVFLAPALGLAIGLHLGGIMVVLAGVSALITLAYLGAAFTVIPAIRHPTIRLGKLGTLFRFGGWVTVSSLLVPILVYGDRLLLSVFRPVAVLAYYTVPFDLTSRLQIVPTSFATVIFPAFTRTWGLQDGQTVRLFEQSLKYLVMMLLPLVGTLLLGAHGLLQLWLGRSFADQGAPILQIVVIGLLLNALAQVPAHLLDAVGRPDLRTKLFAAYLPVYVVLAVILISHLGPLGAALAWLVRATIELCLFMIVAIRKLQVSWVSVFGSWYLRPVGLLAAAVAAAFLIRVLDDRLLAIQLVVSFVSLAMFTPIYWLAVMTSMERARLVGIFVGLRGAAAS